MSKRYGRNQKRRHREEIARQREEVTRFKHAYEMADGLSREFASALGKSQHTIADMTRIIEAICPHSVALPPKRIKCDHPANHWRIPARNRFVMDCYIEGNTPGFQSFEAINLHALRVFLEHNQETFEAAVHLEYMAGNYSAYMISREALWNLPEDILVEKLVPDIARALVGYMREAKP